MNTRKTISMKVKIFCLVAALLVFSIPMASFATDTYNLQIVSVDTDKAVYRMNEIITVNAIITNTGTVAAPGMWVDVWVDKMPIDTLNVDPQYHDYHYQELVNTFGVVTAYMPDPNPCYNPVPNKFIAGPILPGSTRTVSLTFYSTGEATKLQDYTVKVYPWIPSEGEDLSGIVINPATKYGESDSAKNRYAIEGRKATNAYPNGKAAALVLRVDDVQPGNGPQVSSLLNVFNAHNAKGTFMLMQGGANESRTDLLAAIQNGHEVGLHGTDHACRWSADAHIPEATVHGHQPPLTWHEFEGPHFVHLSYDDQYNRMLTTYNEMVSILGVAPKSFCAPQVALSEKTIAACTNLGIKYSTNFVGDVVGEAYWSVVEVPFLGDYTWEVFADNYNSSLEAAKKDVDRIIAKGGVITMVAHTIRMNDLRYQWLNDFLTYTDSKNLWYATVKDVGAWYEQSAKQYVPVSAIPGGAEYLAQQ